MIDINTLLLIPAAGVLTGLGLLVLKYRSRNRQLERLLEDSNSKLEGLQVHFGKFAPQDMIEHLTETQSYFVPSRRLVTVLFADLAGFTSMCEKMDPAIMVGILNGYFKYMSEAISNHHGLVTELTGDGMLALFGALESNPWQAQDAVMGALAMREALKRYNGELEAKSLPKLKFGIGIHQGEVLAGVMGNDQLSKFGVVGDTINVAARVESLTRLHQVDLLITEAIRNKLDQRFSLRRMNAASVKGKQEPIVTYYVKELKNK